MPQFGPLPLQSPNNCTAGDFNTQSKTEVYIEKRGLKAIAQWGIFYQIYDPNERSNIHDD